MTYLPTEEDLALLKSRSKRLYCRIELLNKDYQIIDTIEGLALSGSNSIDADSDTRRTFNLDIFPKSGFSISQFSTEEWTSKMLRLQIGMKAPTSIPLVGADAVRISEEEIDAKIKNSAIYKEKDTELRQAKWRYKVGGYEQYGNIENINRKRIIWTDENKKKYASFVKEQGDVGTYSTVVASSDGYTTNGKTYEIAYTPLLIGGGDVIIPLLNADIRSYIEVIFNAACDAVQRDSTTLQSKILELDSFGVDCTIYGKTVRVKNMIAAVEGGIAAGKTLSAADVAAIAGCTKDELDKYFHDTSVFVGYSMHDIQETIWELKDGLTQIYKAEGKGLSSNDFTTAEKNKLAGIEAGANNYSHPTSSGNKHIPSGGSAGQILRWSKDGEAQWGADNNTTYSAFKGATSAAAGGSGLVPAPAANNAGQFLKGDGTWATPLNTTYNNATSGSAGLMSAGDKAKLDGIAANANNYSHPTSAGNKHIPAGGQSGQILRWNGDGSATWGPDYNTTYSDFKAATASAAGGSGLVPAPAAGKQSQYLRGDGIWATPTNTTYNDATQSVHGLMSTADKQKLDGFGAASTYALKSDITAMYRYKGSVASTDKLPTSGQTIGDVYDVGNGMNYAWNGSAWDALGEIFTITKITNTEIDTVLAS